jgi:hypothetical protein
MLESWNNPWRDALCRVRGHDEAWPSKTDIPHHSTIPIFHHSSEAIDKKKL